MTKLSTATQTFPSRPVSDHTEEVAYRQVKSNSPVGSHSLDTLRLAMSAAQKCGDRATVENIKKALNPNRAAADQLFRERRAATKGMTPAQVHEYFTGRQG